MLNDLSVEERSKIANKAIRSGIYLFTHYIIFILYMLINEQHRKLN